MGELILDLNWEHDENYRRALESKDNYTIKRADNPNDTCQFIIRKETDGEEYKIWYREHPPYYFCSCKQFVLRLRSHSPATPDQARKPCKHLHMVRMSLENSEMTIHDLNPQQTYRIRPIHESAKSFFRIEALKEQLQKDFRENGGETERPKGRKPRTNSAGAANKEANSRKT